MMKPLLSLMLSCWTLLGLSLSARALPNWKNLDDAHWVSGPKLSEADLEGKVVLVDEWGVNCPPCRELLPTMEKVWRAFKNKPFILLGSHRQRATTEEMKALLDANKITYSVYQAAGVEGEPQNSYIPFMYVLDHRGRIIYQGNNEREAREAFICALDRVGQPPDLVGSVILKHYKSYEKRLVLGQPVKMIRGTLENDVKRLSALKKREQKDNEKLAEARGLLAAIATAREDVAADIDAVREKNPLEACRLAKLFIVTFPEEGAQLKADLPALIQAAKEQKAREKAAAAAAR